MSDAKKTKKESLKELTQLRQWVTKRHIGEHPLPQRTSDRD